MPMQLKCDLHFNKIQLKPFFTEGKETKNRSIPSSQELLKDFKMF